MLVRRTASGTLVVAFLVAATVGGCALPANRDENRPDSTAARRERPPNGQLAPSGLPSGVQAATVDRIVDGDTFTMHAAESGPVLRTNDEVTVRLLEIDTPESVKPDEPVQCYGPAASRALSELAQVGSRVWVLADAERRDPYDRLLLYVWTVHGGRLVFVNRVLVSKGYARAVLYEPNDRYIALMREAQRQAMTAERGLWGDCPSFGAPLG